MLHLHQIIIVVCPQLEKIFDMRRHVCDCRSLCVSVSTYVRVCVSVSVSDKTHKPNGLQRQNLAYAVHFLSNDNRPLSESAMKATSQTLLPKWTGAGKEPTYAQPFIQPISRLNQNKLLSASLF